MLLRSYCIPGVTQIPQVGNEQQMSDWISEPAVMKDDRLPRGTTLDLCSQRRRNITAAPQQQRLAIDAAQRETPDIS